MAEEAAPTQGQDPAQGTATDAAPQQAAAAPPAPTLPPQQTVAQPGPGPWDADLQAAFNPEEAARFSAFLRTTVQPRMTQLEQTNVEARQMYEAFQADPYAADIAINRNLYGDDYADELARQIGRNDLVANPAPVQQQAPQPQYAPAPTAPQYQQPVQQEPPRTDENWEYWNNKRLQDEYDTAKAEFLSDPQYADIDPNLFDGFVQNAETWNDAVSAYRNYAAAWEQSHAPQQEQQVAPQTLGSDTVGAPGNTPTQPNESLDQAIDGMFSENKPAPPTF